MKSVLFYITLVFSYDSSAVVGGKTASESEITLALSKFVANIKGCTYTRVSQRHFISASHCPVPRGEKQVPQSNDDFMKVHADKLKFGPDSNKQSVSINKYVTQSYNDWSKIIGKDFNLYSDLMILEIPLEEDLRKINEIEIAQIDFHFDPFKDRELIISGYGCYKEIKSARNHIERKTDGLFRTAVHKISNNNNSYFYTAKLNEGSLRRVCFGDSGGAVFNKYLEVVGVNAFLQREIENKMSAYTRIDTLSSSLNKELSPFRWLEILLGENL